MKIAIYARCSTKRQELSGQIEWMTDQLKNRGLIADKIYSDYKSGLIPPDERNLGKLLKRLKSGDMVYVAELSRLSREAFTLASIANHFIKNNIALVSLKDNYVLQDTLQSKMCLMIMALSYEQEVYMIRLRTKVQKEQYQKRLREGTLTKKLGRPKGAKTQNHFLDSHRTRLINDYHKLIPISQLARRYGCEQKTIRRYLKKYDDNYISSKELKNGIDD